MKLSEAIRLGSMLRPQAFGAMYENNGSCAYGAAYEAIGARFTSKPAIDIWPWLANTLTCPCCGISEQYGASVISDHLNDDHKWPRERIADWVATIEPEESPSVVMEETLEALPV